MLVHGEELAHKIANSANDWSWQLLFARWRLDDGEFIMTESKLFKARSNLFSHIMCTAHVHVDSSYKNNSIIRDTDVTQIC